MKKQPTAQVSDFTTVTKYCAKCKGETLPDKNPDYCSNCFWNYKNKPWLEALN